MSMLGKTVAPCGMTIALAAGVVLVLPNVAGASGTTSAPAYSGPWNSVTYGPGQLSTSPLTSSKIAAEPDFHCVVNVSNVDQYTGPGADLYIYGHQTCIGTDYAEQRVGTSIWRNRWWGGQEVAGWNYSPWTYGTTSTKNSRYLCANDTGYFTYFGYSLGEAQNGDYTQEVRSLDTNNWYCG